jgi:hypothetical protein
MSYYDIDQILAEEEVRCYSFSVLFCLPFLNFNSENTFHISNRGKEARIS